jgi:hypothetical protein
MKITHQEIVLWSFFVVWFTVLFIDLSANFLPVPIMAWICVGFILVLGTLVFSGRRFKSIGKWFDTIVYPKEKK